MSKKHKSLLQTNIPSSKEAKAFLKDGVYDLSLYRKHKKVNLYPKIVIRKKGKQLTIFNDEQIVEIEQLAVTMTIGEIAKHLGIARRTFFDIRKRQPEVLRAYKKGNARKIEYVT